MKSPVLCLIFCFYKEPPFVQLRKDHKAKQGNEKYEGFCIDILNTMEEQFGFQFHVFTAAGNTNGHKTTNWPSERLVGELIREVGKKYELLKCHFIVACGISVTASSKKILITHLSIMLPGR